MNFKFKIGEKVQVTDQIFDHLKISGAIKEIIIAKDGTSYIVEYDRNVYGFSSGRYDESSLTRLQREFVGTYVNEYKNIEKKICPLRFIAYDAPVTIGVNSVVHCVENKCMWWNEEKNFCSQCTT